MGWIFQKIIISSDDDYDSDAPAWPEERSNDVNVYNPESFWDEGILDWVDEDSIDSEYPVAFMGGGRYKEIFVAISNQGVIYFEDF